MTRKAGTRSVAPFRYQYEVGHPDVKPGVYDPADVTRLLMTRCSSPGCDCADIILAVVTEQPALKITRRLVVDTFESREMHALGHGPGLTSLLKTQARRHGMPDCIHGDPDDPYVMGFCLRDHDHDGLEES